MAGSVGRSLVVALKADTKGFSREMRGAHNDIAKFKNGIEKMGKAVAASFAALGAGVAALGVESVKAALEDEKGQRRLAVALKNVTNAKKIDIAATEKYISKTESAFGVVDDKLRPSLQRLVQSTKNVAKAQKLQYLALDISAATGKDLEEVSNALGKAYAGNFVALQRLGLGIKASTIKSKDFNKVYKELNQTVGGQAKAAAESSQGQWDRLQIALNNMKESIGYALLPTMKKLADWMINTGVPNLQTFLGVFTGDKGINASLHDGTIKAHRLGLKVKSFIEFIVRNKDELTKFAAVLMSMWAVGKVIIFTSNVYKAVAAFKTLTVAANAAAAAESRALGGGLLGGVRAVAGRALGAVAGSATGIIGGGLLVGHKIYSDADKAIMGNTKKQALFNLQSRMQAMGLVNQTPAVKSQRARMEKAYQKIDINVSGNLNARDTALAIQKILQQYSLTGFPIQTVGKTTP